MIFEHNSSTRYSVAMRVNDGRIFNDFSIANLLLSVMVKEFWISVRIWQSYGKNKVALFFPDTVYISWWHSWWWLYELWTLQGNKRHMQRGVKLFTVNGYIGAVRGGGARRSRGVLWVHPRARTWWQNSDRYGTCSWSYRSGCKFSGNLIFPEILANAWNL